MMQDKLFEAEARKFGYEVTTEWPQFTAGGPPANAAMVAEFRAGKEKAFNALVGQAMKATKGKANPQQVNELLRKKLG